MSIKIMLDAGHSSNISVGARGNGLKEEEVCLKIVKKVGSILSKHKVDVLYTRTNGNAMSGATSGSSDLNLRCSYANKNNVNYFVSIHNNSASSTSANGIETLYNDRFSKSKTIATNIQNQLISDTGMRNRGLKFRDNLAVLNQTKMPSCLVEVGFLSNVEDVNKLKKDEFIDVVANSIAKGICKTVNVIMEAKKDADLENALKVLSDKGIKLSLDNWKSIDVIELKNVDALLSRLGGIDSLVKKGIISDADLWKSGKYTKNNVRALIIKASKML